MSAPSLASLIARCRAAANVEDPCSVLGTTEMRALLSDALGQLVQAEAERLRRYDGILARPGQPTVEDHAREQNAADLAAKAERVRQAQIDAAKPRTWAAHDMPIRVDANGRADISDESIERIRRAIAPPPPSAAETKCRNPSGATAAYIGPYEPPVDPSDPLVAALCAALLADCAAADAGIAIDGDKDPTLDALVAAKARLSAVLAAARALLVDLYAENDPRLAQMALVLSRALAAADGAIASPAPRPPPPGRCRFCETPGSTPGGCEWCKPHKVGTTADVPTHAPTRGSGLAVCGAPRGAFTVTPGTPFTCEACSRDALRLGDGYRLAAADGEL